MLELALAALVWGGFMAYVGAVPRERAQLAWLALLALLALGPLLAVFWPALR